MAVCSKNCKEPKKSSTLVIDTYQVLAKKNFRCGTEAVVCSWNGSVMVIGRSSDFILYTYDGPVHLVTEIDGVRVISSNSHEMIQKVPNVVQKIFRINSTDSASYLLEAAKQFRKRSHKADSYIDLVKDNLDVAITDCVNAASHEFDPETQKLLMQVNCHQSIDSRDSSLFSESSVLDFLLFFFSL